MARRPALLVIGPSRSGSSALTAVLAMLGAALPAALIPPGEGNPRGHFEPRRLVDLNDEILALHGITYWDPIAVPPAWFAGAEAAAMVTTIAELIAAEYADAALPVLKDPRICRLAPLYCAALDRLGYATHAVIPRRHPAAAAGSLNTRDGTPPETAELLHIRELLGAEYHTRLLPRAWCDFDDLLADWRRHTADIATSLRLHWPIHPDDAAPAIDAFLTPALRHHTAATGPAAGPLAMRLHTACHAGDEPTLRSEFDAVRAVTDELDRLTLPWQSAWRHRLATLAAPVGGTPPPG